MHRCVAYLQSDCRLCQYCFLRYVPFLTRSYFYSELRIRAAYLALLAYEYVITFAEEVRLVWGRPVTITSVLLLTVRWMMVAYATVGMSPSTPKVRCSLRYHRHTAHSEDCCLKKYAVPYFWKYHSN